MIIAKLFFDIYWIAAWWGTASVPWLLLLGHKTANGSIETLFSGFGVLFPCLTFLWITAAWSLFGTLLLPWTLGAPGHRESFELLFSRAIDRKKLYRVKVFVIFFAMVGP
ncbi:MAG TPA: hypothetical protein VGN61_15740, partial [Verrucomicrobiae bacterium]